MIIIESWVLPRSTRFNNSLIRAIIFSTLIMSSLFSNQGGMILFKRGMSLNRNQTIKLYLIAILDLCLK